MSERNLPQLRKYIKRMIRELDDLCVDEYSEYSSEEEDESSDSDFEMPVRIKNCAKYSTNNFLVPSLNGCVKAIIHVHSGRDFWTKLDLPRTTFAAVKLHPQLPYVNSKICTDTIQPAYNLEHVFDIRELNFDGIVPIIEVMDKDDIKGSSLFGRASISMQTATEINNRITVLEHSDIPIVTPLNRSICGFLQVSLVFLRKESQEIIDDNADQQDPDVFTVTHSSAKHLSDVSSQTARVRMLNMNTQTELGTSGSANSCDYLADIDECGREKPPPVPRERRSNRPVVENSDDDMMDLLDPHSYAKYDDFDWKFPC